MVDTASVVVMVSCVTASGVVLESVEGPTVDTTSNVADSVDGGAVEEGGNDATGDATVDATVDAVTSALDIWVVVDTVVVGSDVGVDVGFEDGRGDTVVAAVLEDGTGSNVAVVVGGKGVVVGRKKVAGG
jgi:hypothetical protein